MPILEDDNMDDRALLWSNLGDGPDGQPVHDTPTEIWVEYRRRRRVVISADGTKFNVDATMSATADIALNSLIWVAPSHLTSALDQWYASGSAGFLTERMRVETQGVTRDQKNIETRYTYGLVWDRDEES